MGTSKNQEAASGAAVKKRGQFKEIWRRLKKNKMAMIGLGIVAFLVLISIFADFLFDYNTVVIKQNTAIRLQTPSAAHWLGTDEFGRDILARLVHGSRVSLSVGVVAVVQVSLKVASAILSTSGLSFLGLGVKAPTPEWGAMLSGGRAYLRNAPHLTVFPGIAIIITILSLNLLGDGLRDALDPKLKK